MQPTLQMPTPRRTRRRPPLRPGAWMVLAATLIAACDNKVSPEAYARWTDTLVAEGKMRIDIEAPDLPYTDAELAENFRRIALYHETDPGRVGGADNRSRQPIHKWGGPVRYALIGGGAGADDLAILTGFASRVRDATGLDIRPAAENVNLFIAITTPEERGAFSESMGRSGLRPLRADFDRWRRDPNWICGGNVLISTDEPNRIVAGMIFLDDGVSGRLREACLHEEFAQILGLFNDDPEVRPSLFTDTSEFARLTVHDAELLAILYDPRIEPGMTEAEAMALVPEIIRDLRRKDLGSAAGHAVSRGTGEAVSLP